MAFECRESCFHMKVLHDCESTKDAMLLCKKDQTFIPIHKVVGAHGSPHPSFPPDSKEELWVGVTMSKVCHFTLHGAQIMTTKIAS